MSRSEAVGEFHTTSLRGMPFRVEPGEPSCGQGAESRSMRMRPLPARRHCNDQVGQRANRRIPLRIVQLSLASQLRQVVEHAPTCDR